MLTFNLKKVWFDKIKSGEKTHEYREFKDYWTDRFIKDYFNVDKKSKEFEPYKKIFCDTLKMGYGLLCNHKICFMNGMMPEEKQPRMYARMRKIKLLDGLKTDLKINAPVYDIEFELIKDAQNAD